MSDMMAAIEPKSDQINAEDLLGGDRIITITGVQVRAGAEQPVSMSFAGSEKVFRPCKTVSRILVKGWGPDSGKYLGRSLQLYRDPDVLWGGMKVGGIRVRAMSHIDGPLTLALAESKKARKITTVQPLAVDTPDVTYTIDDARGWLEAATTVDDLRRAWASKDMRPFRDTLAKMLDQRKRDLEILDEGPADTQRGEAHATVDAEADIMAELARKEIVADVDALVRRRSGELGEDGQQRLREAAMARIVELRGSRS